MLDWQYHWGWLRLCRSALRFWKANVLPYQMANHRVPKVYLRGVDPDFRNFDVDQSVDLFLSYADPSHQGPDQTSAGLDRLLDSIQHHPHCPMDCSMSPASRSLEVSDWPTFS